MSNSVFREFDDNENAPIDHHNRHQQQQPVSQSKANFVSKNTSVLTTATTNGGSGVGGLLRGAQKNNVVIVLNKDGTVSVDQCALHSFLKDEGGTTAVSVVRVQSPTPSLRDELEGAEDDQSSCSSGGRSRLNSDDFEAAPGRTGSRHGYEDDEAFSSGSDAGIYYKDEDSDGARKRHRARRRGKRDQAPHLRLTVEQYLPPEEAKKFAAEILQYAGMTSALTLDYDFHRYVVQNDHCYTPLTSPTQKEKSTGQSVTTQQQQQQSQHRQQVRENSGNANKVTSVNIKGLSRRAQSKLAATELNRKKVDDFPDEYLGSEGTKGNEDKDSDFDEQVAATAAEEEEDNDADFTPSESDNDRDSDLDFSVNDRGNVSKKRKNARKSNSARPNQTNTSFHHRHSSGHQQSHHHHQLSHTASTKGGSNHSNSSSNSLTNSSRQGSSSGHQSHPSAATLHGNSTKKKQLASQSGNLSAKNISNERILNRGISVGAKKSNSTETPITKSIRSTPQSQQQPPQSQPIQPSPVSQKKEKEKPEEVAALFSDMSNLFSTPDIIKKAPGTMPTTRQGHHQQQQQPQSSLVAPTAATSLNPNAFELDLIDSIVKDQLEDGLNDDTSLLEGITSDDGGLPEELLQHVAELVENKSLQEVIDKQVLGVEVPLLNLTDILPVAPAAPATNRPPPIVTTPAVPVEKREKESPFVKLAQQRQLAKQSAAVAATITGPRKEPIKVVRSDGRVITLPPIEAPTTRGAKRRAQSSDMSSSPAAGSVSSSPGDTTVALELGLITPDEQPQQPPMVVKRKNSTAAERRTSTASASRRQSTTPSVAESDVDDTWNSEDDPDRLWCICKQPHNNGFMICCDKCEDWFHGRCVDVTKAMGQQMEAAGIEWTCPNCLHLKGPAKHMCIVCKTVAAKPNSIYCSDQCIIKHSQRAQQQQQQQQQNQSEPSSGVSHNSVATEGGGELNKKIGVLKNKNGRVIVYNASTGQYLSGDKAPLLSNLKRWLEENPSYDVVQPGSALAQAFRAKHSQLQQLSKDMALKRKLDAENNVDTKIQAKLKMTSNKQVVIVHPKSAQQIKVTQGGKSSPVTTTSTTTPTNATTPGSSGPATPTSSVKTKKVLERSTSSGGGGGSTSPRSMEPIRINVRRTLKEQLLLRMSELPADDSNRLTDAEITTFVADTEKEMFLLFNRDTNQKYKAKYRSLMFNIRDRKNQTLFQKICGKAIRPSRLVRMSPEEMASQELAQWRENENKHQLEMITKSEMDLMSVAKSYVLKSHKGEEVLENMINESKIEAVDDVTMLNAGSKKDLTGDDSVSSKGQRHSSGTSLHESSRHKTNTSSSSKDEDRRSDRKRDRSRGRDSGHHRHSSSSSSSKHHKRKRSRERSRDRDKERDRDKDRSSSKHSKSSVSSSSHHGSGHHHHHHQGGSSAKEGSSRHHKLDKSSSIKEESNHSSSPASTSSSTATLKRSESKYQPITKKEAEESYDLIEKILQGTSPELVGKLQEIEKNKVVDQGQAKPAGDEVVVKKETISAKTTTAAIDFEEYNPESADPTAKAVTTESPLVPLPLSASKKAAAPFWSGSINMIDVANFHMTATAFSGDVDDIRKDFPYLLEIVGRINPDTVWDYLGKIKRIPNKEIVLVRFSAKTAAEDTLYETFFSYLDQRKRLGVIKMGVANIKDFYVVPLAKGKQLPPVLLSLSGAGGFHDEDSRPNLLIGVIVKIKLKRSSGSGSSSGGSSSKLPKKVSSIRSDFTPPDSPKLKASSSGGSKLIPGLPKRPSSSAAATILDSGPLNNDDDEPYSPGGSDEDIPTSVITPSSSGGVVGVSASPLEIKKKMEELNRQIEAQKMEIAEMLTKDTLDEPYSPSRPMSPSQGEMVKAASKAAAAAIPMLANISIPANLQEILASIKSSDNKLGLKARAAPMVMEEEDDDEEYNPIPAVVAAQNSVTYKPSEVVRPESPSTRAFLLAQQQNRLTEEIPFISSSSKLSHMSDAELMRLVPDDVDLGMKATAAAAAPPTLIVDDDDDEDQVMAGKEPPPPGMENAFN